jgi:hypothetical protein
MLGLEIDSKIAPVLPIGISAPHTIPEPVSIVVSEEEMEETAAARK